MKLRLTAIYISTSGSASAGSVLPQAGFEKCAANFSKEAGVARTEVRCPDSILRIGTVEAKP